MKIKLISISSKLMPTLNIVELKEKDMYSLKREKTTLLTFKSTQKKTTLKEVASLGKAAIKLVTEFLESPKAYFAKKAIADFKFQLPRPTEALTPAKQKALHKKLSAILDSLPKEFRKPGFDSALKKILSAPIPIETRELRSNQANHTRVLKDTDTAIIKKIRAAIRELGLNLTLTKKDGEVIASSKIQKITPTIIKRIAKLAPELNGIIPKASTNIFKYNLTVGVAALDTSGITKPSASTVSDVTANTGKEIRAKASKIGSHSKTLSLDLNGKSKFPLKGFGYWRPTASLGKSGLPFPVAFKVKGYAYKDFKPKLDKWITRASTVHYKGNSQNRWTGSSNGSGEYSLNGWKMPAGALYYLARGVPPTQEFYKEVMGKTNHNLPTQLKYHAQ